MNRNSPRVEFPAESKPVEVIVTLNRFGEQDNEIDDRAGEF